jgi:hypothetical protein
MAVLHKGVAYEAKPGFLAGPLAIEARLGIGARGRSKRFWPWKSTSALRPAAGGLGGRRTAVRLEFASPAGGSAPLADSLG